MKRLATVVAATLMIALASFAGAAPAQAADGYGISIDINDVDLCHGGDADFVIKATASPPVDADWTLTFRGEEVTGSGSSITHTFHAPHVDETTVFTVTAEATFDTTDPVFQSLGGGGAGRLSMAVVAATDTASATATVTVHKKCGKNDGDDDDGHHKKHKKHKGHLPNTGGERLAWLIIGLLLVGAGATVVASSRKRDSVA